MRSEGYRDLVKCSVSIELNNGRLLMGIVEKPRSKTLAEYFNNGDAFIDVTLVDGTLVQVAKSAIATCEQVVTAKPDPLKSASAMPDADNPLTVLGLQSLESKEQVRQAYLARMRLYHSDRFGGVELPREVIDHMEQMTKRINAAYRSALALCERGGRAAAH